ncbi:MAG: hypothetical protein LW834_06500 [Cyanobium sp. 49614_E6]|jgi:hypothetical protein|nr:hypothetical protein [Cyanobium sp. 49614_E6]
MKRFSLPIPSAWRNPKRLPIPTHAELVERVAVLMERVARQDVRLGRFECRLEAIGAGNRDRFFDPALGRPWQESEDFVPDGSGYMIPRAVVMHLTEADLAALEHLKTEPGVVQPLQPGEVIAPIPTPVSERPWALEGWRNASGECWWSPRKGPAYWRMVDPTFVQAGWLLPHYAIPVIPVAPSPEGGQR